MLGCAGGVRLGRRGLRCGLGVAVDVSPGGTDALVDAPQDGDVVEQRGLRRRGRQVGDDLVPRGGLLFGEAGVGRAVVGLVAQEAEARRHLVLDVDVLEEHVALGRRELVVDLDGVEDGLRLLVGQAGRVEVAGLHRFGVGVERHGEGLAADETVGSEAVGPGLSQTAERRRPQRHGEPDNQSSIAGVTGHTFSSRLIAAADPQTSQRKICSPSAHDSPNGYRRRQ